MGKQPESPGLPLVRKWETKKNWPYLDPIGIPTQGYGAIRGLTGAPVKITDARWTDDQCDQVLARDWLIAVKGISPIVLVQLTPNEMGALGCWVFNLGETKLRHSTLLKEINSSNGGAVAIQWMKWDMAGGRVLEGLEHRRAEELQLWQAS